MSDVGLPNMDWLLEVFYAICVFGLPLIIGLLFLLIGRFVSGYRRLLLGLYFIVSTMAVIAISWWLFSLFNVWEILYLSPLSGILGAAIDYGIYHLLNLLWRKLLPKKLAQ